jgi:NADH:ubiquinone oxidoreductase subunit 4 (subunit M)
MSLLTSIILVPFLGALAVALIPRNYRFVIRLVALASTLVTMLLAIAMFLKFDAAAATTWALMASTSVLFSWARLWRSRRRVCRIESRRS